MGGLENVSKALQTTRARLRPLVGCRRQGYIVVLDGPFTEQQPLRGQTTAEDENAFRMWHAQKAKDAQDRATRRQLGEDVVVGYFYVAAGEPSS